MVKKIISIVLSALLLLSAVALADDAEPIRMGQVEYAAHGTRGFAVITVAMQGDKIVAAKIDEFQVMKGEGVVGVPNSDADFGASIVGAEEGNVLASKKVNSDYYSANMTRAGSTVAIADNFAALEAFVIGKTAAQLEAVTGYEPAVFVDAVSGATLVDSVNYVKGVLAAVYAADAQTGKYTIYNKTGETVTSLTLKDNVTGEVGANLAGAGMAPDAVMTITTSLPGSEDGHGRLTLDFVTESGYAGTFATLSIEVAPITLLAPDAMTGATQISFFAPAE